MAKIPALFPEGFCPLLRWDSGGLSIIRKRKARVGIPPGFLDARFFPDLVALPGSVDFPPEINSKLYGLAF